MINPSLKKELEQLNIADLERPDLGVHFSFKSSIPVLEKLYLFLRQIVDHDSPRLIEEDSNNIETHINILLHLRKSIREFNPADKDNATTYQKLVSEINAAWEGASRDLRGIYNFAKLDSLDVDQVKSQAQQTLDEILKTKEKINDIKVQIDQLPVETENKFNESFKKLQERLSNDEQNLRKEISNLEVQAKSSIDSFTENAKKQTEQISNKLTNLSSEVERRLKEVDQQAKKFSAKNALSTYSEIFLKEAEGINKKAIRKWEIILVALVVLEVAAALILFFIFLPEVLQIASTYGEELVGLGLVISIVLVKIFILSVIAVGINQAVKNLNAQNHLYATNKFKSNALASFKAFLDATDNEEVIDGIIKHVSTAVYTQGISGYLSKDEGTVKVIDKDSAGLFSKVLGM